MSETNTSNEQGREFVTAVQTQEKAQPKPKDVLLLGGADLEMRRLERKARKAGAEVIDLALSWEEASKEGITKYKEHVEEILAAGDTPVAVELTGADQIPGVVDIDHHNEKAGRPASITQTLERLGIKQSFIDGLVAANDSAYIPGMEQYLDREYKDQYRSIHAKQLEKEGREFDEAVFEESYEKRKKSLIDLIRRKDREVQGVTEEDEKEAEEAIVKAEHLPNGLVVTRLNGARPSVVTDRLYSSWPEGRQNLVVVCNDDKDEKEVWFFGRGDVCKGTRDHFFSLKEKQIADGTRVGNENHAWGGGVGYGKEDGIAQIGVVARNPEDVIKYIVAAEG